MSKNETVETVMVRYGDLWASIEPDKIRFGYGGGELAEFPDLSAFKKFLEAVERAWNYVHRFEADKGSE